MKKRLLCLCLPLLLSPFAFGCSAETKNVDRCSLAKELAKGSPIDVSNPICTFSGGNIGPFISGEDFKTTLEIEVKEAASYYVSIYFIVASKKTLVGGSNSPTSFPSSRRKRTFQVNIPKTLFISQDGGAFSVHVEASTGLIRGQKADFQVSLPLSSRGEVVNYDCESGPISFPNYLYYWSSPNLLSPSPLTFSLDGSSSKMALYKEQDNDSYDYLLISNVGVVIDYPANQGPHFKAELRLYDRFSDFPIAKTGDHIKIPMSHYFTFGG
ncbi:MAG: hypothetical protein J6328_03750, partial [Bacilli bacterium]|nr:hypothetical protein [Bacilli bacterium]